MSESRYQSVRELFLQDRVTLVHGSLAGESSILDIAADARKRGMKVHTIYLSNAPEWLDPEGTSRMHKNLAQVPRSRATRVLRTNQDGRRIKGDGWGYRVNRFGTFKIFNRIDLMRRQARLRRQRKGPKPTGRARKASPRRASVR